jgi:hypothetical protein
MVKSVSGSLVWSSEKEPSYGFLTELVEMGSSAPQDVEYSHGERVEAGFGNSSTLYCIGADADFC